MKTKNYSIPNELFEKILTLVNNNNSNYTSGRIKWMEHCQQEDFIFEKNYCDKALFFEELKKRNLLAK